jgi:hypothetical protein
MLLIWRIPSSAFISKLVDNLIMIASSPEREAYPLRFNHISYEQCSTMGGAWRAAFHVQPPIPSGRLNIRMKRSS